jgi:preprotein translocase subunit Sec61beta
MVKQPWEDEIEKLETDPQIDSLVGIAVAVLISLVCSAFAVGLFLLLRGLM